MKLKTFTNLLRHWVATSVVLFVSFLGVFAQEVPYPVWFDLGDQPEFRSIPTYRKAAASTAFTNGSVAGIKWIEKSAVSLYHNSTVTGSDVFIFGDRVDIDIAKISRLDLKTPYLVKGTYEVWISYRAQGQYCWIDSAYLGTGADSVKQYLNEAGTLQLGNWGAGSASRSNTLVAKGPGNVQSQYICRIVVETSGSYWLKLYMRNKDWVSGRGFDQLMFFPMKLGKTVDGANDSLQLTNNYYRDTVMFTRRAEYIKRQGSNIHNADITAANPVMKVPYQAIDSSNYTKFNVSILFGSFFGDAPVQILRDEDKWTRMVIDTLPVNGTIPCQLPAGKYYYLVKDGILKGSFTVTGDGTFDFAPATYTVTIDAGPEAWTIGTNLKVYDLATKSILNGEAVFDITGKATVTLLSGQYYYTINGAFDNGTFTVVDANLNIDKKKVKQTVTFNCGSDAWFTSKTLKVWLNADRTIEMYSGATNASGDVTMQLPTQTYYYNLADGMQVDTFSVLSSAKTHDFTGRYNSTYNVGNVVNGFTLDVYRNDTLKVYTGLVAGGVQNFNSIPNGKYHFRLYKTGVDSTMAIAKQSFKIAGSNYVYGDAGNLNNPLSVAYPVYFDICQQPEIIWGKGGQTFAANTITGIKTSSNKIITYNYATTGGANDQYINGDHLVVGIDTVGLYSAGINPFILFRTPWINAGLYNVYISNRWTNPSSRPIIDSTYLDGKLLSVTDGIIRTLDNWPNGAVTRAINGVRQSGSTPEGGNIAALHLGSVQIETNGIHELKLVSKLGGTTVALDMLEFIPVDQDLAINNNFYYPRFDRCGNALFVGFAADNTLNSDGSDHAVAYQAKDPSVLIGFTKQLVFDAGAMSSGDVVTLKKVEDNWTRVWQRTFNADADTTNLLAGSYNFSLKHEGLSGTFTMNDNYTVTIPTSIPTIVSGWAKLYKDESLDTAQRNIDLKVNVAMDFSNYSLNIDTMKGTSDVLVSAIAFDPYLHGITDTLKLQAVDIAVGANNNATSAFLATGIQAKYLGWGRFTASNGYLTATDVVTSNQFAKDATLRTFPNPAKETLFIQTSKVGTKDSYIIYNALGNVVGSGKLKASTTSVNLKGLPSGVYYVKIKAGTSTTTSKLMKE